jgi:hypothetical protein
MCLTYFQLGHLFRPKIIIENGIFTKNKIEGAASLAFLKMSLTAFSDSPTHLVNNYQN